MTAPYANYIVEYYDGIKNGRYVVGKWIRLVYEYVVAGLQRGDFFFNAKKANKAIRFIENFCHHCEGRTDLLKLEVWQKAAVMHQGEVAVPSDRGRRMYVIRAHHRKSG